VHFFFYIYAIIYILNVFHILQQFVFFIIRARAHENLPKGASGKLGYADEREKMRVSFAGNDSLGIRYTCIYRAFSTLLSPGIGVSFGVCFSFMFRFRGFSGHRRSFLRLQIDF